MTTSEGFLWSRETDYLCPLAKTFTFSGPVNPSWSGHTTIPLNHAHALCDNNKIIVVLSKSFTLASLKPASTEVSLLFRQSIFAYHTLELPTFLHIFPLGLLGLSHQPQQKDLSYRREMDCASGERPSPLATENLNLKSWHEMTASPKISWI